MKTKKIKLIKNIWLARIKQNIADIDSGNILKKDGISLINNNFQNWLGQAKKDGTTGSKDFFDIVKDLRIRGLEIPAINKFIIDCFKKGLEGYKKMKLFKNIKIDVYEEMIKKENDKINKR